MQLGFERYMSKRPAAERAGGPRLLEALMFDAALVHQHSACTLQTEYVPACPKLRSCCAKLFVAANRDICKCAVKHVSS